MGKVRVENSWTFWPLVQLNNEFGRSYRTLSACFCCSGSFRNFFFEWWACCEFIQPRIAIQLIKKLIYIIVCMPKCSNFFWFNSDKIIIKTWLCGCLQIQFGVPLESPTNDAQTNQSQTEWIPNNNYVILVGDSCTETSWIPNKLIPNTLIVE